MENFVIHLYRFGELHCCENHPFEGALLDAVLAVRARGVLHRTLKAGERCARKSLELNYLITEPKNQFSSDLAAENGDVETSGRQNCAHDESEALGHVHVLQPRPHDDRRAEREVPERRALIRAGLRDATRVPRGADVGVHAHNIHVA